MGAPRVLIISNNSFSNVFNNGKTLEALFSSFPKENIAQLYLHEGSEPDFSFCENYWKISEIDLIKSLRYGRERIGLKVERQQLTDTTNDTKQYPAFLKLIKDKTGNRFRDLLWCVLTWESPALRNWIKAFNPHVLFFVGSSAEFSSKIALRLSSEYSLPLAVYYTDDYLFSQPNKTYFEKKEFRRVEKLYKQVINSSKAQFAIGKMMAEEYGEYFKKSFVPVMNAVQIIMYEPLQQKDKLDIIYFGGLHLNRWRMLVRLSSLLPMNCALKVYTSLENVTDDVQSSFEAAQITYVGSLSGAALREAMIKADVLLHVESDDIQNRRFTRLAVSTKIPEYLSTGRPVLGFGPSEVASMRILSDNQIGIVVGSDECDDAITNRLSHFLEDFQSRKELGKRGFEYAKMHFDKSVVSNKFREELMKLV